MKIKHLFIIAGLLALLAAFAIPVQAQRVHTSDRPGAGSFFGPNVASLIVSNLVSITNYTIPGVLGGTNMTGTTYTNKAGSRVVTTATVGTNTALLSRVGLWSRSDGSPAFSPGSTNYWAVANMGLGDGNISVTTQSGSGANTALLLVFAPVWDGVNVDTSGSFDFVWSTGNLTASSTQTLHTNLPMARWTGAKALACKSITYADTDASSQVAVRALNINGFVPQ
jgi:hypothetical protein